ncbi:MULTISPECIES: toprim domain-containing protein [Enterobacteriaceae]|uniref:toprim domain-containing protein n=1 Tax=Enterobacterales TaxID=91347 RepID=UPI001F14DDA3|nr:MULTISPECIES: toprim domain-containing protein [Enterobacterales]
MSRAKAWRRAALATYIAAGAALTLAGYTVATTAANANTLRDTRERIEDFQREQTAIAENSISAASVRRGTLPPDTRPPVAPDWPALAERAMPSVVALAGIDKPYGTGQNNHAWRIPGVQQNAATAALTRIRAWHRDWPKEDAKRRQRIICGGVAVEGNKVLTVAHCVEGQEALRVRTAAGEWREARVIGADISRDVALIETEGDKKGEKSGFYVGHLDGHPAGYIKNNRTGVEMKWKAKGYALDPAEKAKMQAEAAAKLAARAEEQERQHEATAQRIGRQAQSLVPITEPTPYLRDKGLQVHAGVLTDQEGQKTYIPAYDADGKQWTMQYIQEDGTKRFAKDSRKEGCFHVVGGMDALAAAPALVIGEGYATAATVAEALGHATVAAFDSGNLQAVAEALHAKFPDKPVVIAGDDDRQVQITQGVNPGRTKAQEAAKAVGGKAIFPIFAPGENAYPKELPPITPENYRNHLHAEKRLADAAAGKVQLSEADTAKLKESLLNDGQLAALSNMKKHTDFNDLSERSSLGKDGVERQVRSAVGKVLLDEGQRQKVQQLKQQDIEQQEQRQRRARTY